MHLLRSALGAFALLFVALLAGCSGGSSSGSGELTLVLTDAASDEIDVFEVDVTDITFTKLNGSTVSVLGRATRIDFASLETLSEMVAGISLEAGFYTGVSMTLDFSNAAVCIRGQTTPATVLDKDGNPITGTVPVQMTFSAGARPQITVARHHLYVLDLDLDQAVSVDSMANTVTFSPVLSASIDPTNPKPVTGTGLLTAVDTIASQFTLQKRALDNSVIGDFTVRTSGLTVFQIDGVVSLGATGLLNLQALVGSTPRVFVQGFIDPVERVVHALAVESGAGVPGNGQDWVLGHIVARDNGAGSDARLTVLGRSVDAGTGTRTFNTLHSVDVMLGTTKVLRRGAGNTLTTDALQVGQLVWVFGNLTGTTLDATATTGVARMLRTSVYGIATGAPVNNTMTLNVTRFDLRDISNFNFMVGGNPEAAPATYTVDVTGLDTSGVTNGSKIRCFGWVNPVGVGGDDDFAALSFVNHSGEGKVLFCQWVPPNAGGLTSITSTELTMDVSAAGLSVVGDGFSPVTVTNSPAPTVKPLLGLGIYRIVQGGSVEIHLLWSSFASSLQTRTAGGAGVFRVAAFGTYDQGTQAFSALVASVILD